MEPPTAPIREVITRSAPYEPLLLGISKVNIPFAKGIGSGPVHIAIPIKELLRSISNI